MGPAAKRKVATLIIVLVSTVNSTHTNRNWDRCTATPLLRFGCEQSRHPNDGGGEGPDETNVVMAILVGHARDGPTRDGIGAGDLFE